MCNITVTVKVSHVLGVGGIVCNSNSVQTKIFVKLKRFQILPSLQSTQSTLRNDLVIVLIRDWL